MPDLHTFTREVVLNTKPGTVFYTELIGTGPGRFVIKRGYAGLCAYLELPVDHPVVATRFEPDCHGGMTFDNHAIGSGGKVWAWGWDYAHFGDAMTFWPPEANSHIEDAYSKTRNELPFNRLQMREEKLWLPLDVWADSQNAIAELRQAIAAHERRAAVRRAIRWRPSRPGQFDTMGRYRLGIPAKRKVKTPRDMRRDAIARRASFRRELPQFFATMFRKRQESHRNAPRSD
jgi:hypothetical protein